MLRERCVECGCYLEYNAELDEWVCPCCDEL